MGFYLYQACLLVFVIQGILTPVIVVLAGLVWRRQAHRLEALQRHLAHGRAKEMESKKSLEATLRGLPKLQPLNCPACGGGLLLTESDTVCPHCQKHGDLPADYAALAPLKRRLEKIVRSALRYWRAAHILTLPFLRGLFLFSIFAEVALFPGVLIGSNIFRNTWFDRVFNGLGLGGGVVIFVAALASSIVMMIVFIILAQMNKELRRKLPVVPALSPASSGQETANCRDCGGSITYGAGDFACICPYCNVVNIRAELIRRERVIEEGNQIKIKSILFQAMEIIEDFIATFFFVTVILFVGFLGLIVWCAVKQWLK